MWSVSVFQRQGRVALGACLSAFALVGLVGPASSTDLETQRQSVFNQLFQAPADRVLMIEYARLSIALRDFEAAAATLERLVDLEPGNAQARRDLAIAYFALGNYQLAEYHLGSAAASGGLSAAELADVDAYRGESARRDAPSRLSGEIAAGFLSADGDHGALVSGEITWRYDLGDANATDWVTEAALSSIQIDGSPSASDTRAFRLRTGPELRLIGEAYGARLQPYLQFERLRFEDNSARDYDAAFLGAAIQNPLGPVVTIFADAAIGHGELRQGGGDINFHRASAGLSVSPQSLGDLRLSFSHEREDAPGRDETARIVRAEYSQDFEAAALPLITDWTGGGFAAIAWRDIDIPFAARDETVRTAGLFVRAHLPGDLFVETRATRLIQDGGSDASTTLLSMQLGWEF